MSDIAWFWRMNSAILLKQDKEMVDFMRPKLPSQYQVGYTILVSLPHDINLQNYTKLVSEFYPKETGVITAYVHVTIKLVVLVIELL